MLLYNSKLLFKLICLKKFSNLEIVKHLRSVRTPRPNYVTNSSNDESISSQTNSGYNYLGIIENEDAALVQGELKFDKTNIKFYQDQIKNKYQPLIENQNLKLNGFKRNFWFGKIRLDSENQPKIHGEFEYRNNGDEFNEIKRVQEHLKQKIDDKSTKSYENYWPKKNYNFEIEVVEMNKSAISNINPLKPLALDNRISFRYSNQLFEKQENQTMCDDDQENDWLSYEKLKRQSQPIKGAPEQKPELSLDEKLASIKLESFVKSETIPVTKPEIMTGNEYLKQIEEGKRTALLKEEFDDIKKFRPTKIEKLDSKGYRILKNQVLNFSKLTNDEILDLLINRVLFNDSDIVALNKPYGVSVHGVFGSKNLTSRSTKLNGINLISFLPLFAKRLECSKLYTVHRLDRDTTGVLLLAKTQEKAHQLNRLFQKQEIQKKYICIVKNKPDKPEGIIDIPIELGYIKIGIKKRERMVLCPEAMTEIRHHRQWRTAKRAITHYKVISEQQNTALLEVYPTTGVRHQIRVHLGFGIRCPILGDHKYSSMNSLAPQKLPSDVLMALKVRQAKVRHIPMHLHAYSVMIPQAGTHGQNIFVRAPLPYHFKRNMKSLSLRND